MASRYTFRRLFLAGVTALLSDGVGFAVLMIIQIQVIQDLAITASIGVLVLIFTNLILIPILLSYLGVGKRAAERARVSGETQQLPRLHSGFLLRFTEKPWAHAAVAGGRDSGDHGHYGGPAICRLATWTKARPSCARTPATIRTSSS